MSLAERLDKFYEDYDPYEYDDAGATVLDAERILRELPETVISDLLDILEEMI